MRVGMRWSPVVLALMGIASCSALAAVVGYGCLLAAVRSISRGKCAPDYRFLHGGSRLAGSIDQSPPGGFRAGIGWDRQVDIQRTRSTLAVSVWEPSSTRKK